MKGLISAIFWQNVQIKFKTEIFYPGNGLFRIKNPFYKKSLLYGRILEPRSGYRTAMPDKKEGFSNLFAFLDQ